MDGLREMGLFKNPVLMVGLSFQCRRKECILVRNLNCVSTPDLAASLQNGHHKKLNQLVGNRTGQTKTCFEPSNPIDDSPVAGTIRPLFDGRFVLHEYKGHFKGQDFEGIAIYGYHLKTEKFQPSWMDTFHMGTGIMLSEGNKSSPFYEMLGAMKHLPKIRNGGAGEPRSGWWMAMGSSSRLTYLPSGEEAKASETVYTRKHIG